MLAKCFTLATVAAILLRKCYMTTKTTTSATTYTTGEIADICDVAPRTAVGWIDAGLLKGYRIPGSKDRRVHHDDLVAFMRAHGFNESMIPAAPAEATP